MSPNTEDGGWLQAMCLATVGNLPFALKVGIDLDLLEIIAKASTSNRMLSPTEIASKLPTNNPDAPSIIDRILRLLASHSILTCNLVSIGEDGHTQRLYGLSSIGKYFIQDEDGVSLAPHLDIFTEKHIIQCWKFMKDATLEGGFSSDKAFGMHLFELLEKDSEMSSIFNTVMSKNTIFVMNKLLETYKGFESVSQVVDVAGGWGTNLKHIVSKYPHIKGINFDLPQVIKDAPHCPGVEHVGGDMFTEVPHGEVIFMKCVFHDWSDEQCMKLLKNCYEAIPEGGKVIFLESMVPEVAMTDLVTTTTLNIDLGLLHCLPGANERTKKEFEALAKEAFTSLKVVCRAYNYWVIELQKNIYIDNLIV
ncbi:hypothetical protein PTKIN_Ptkin01aG0375800 [Pterospermum kingtungense]